jgi:hypothetical protein
MGAVESLRHARQSLELARGFGRSKLYRSVVPLTRLSQVRIEAYYTPLGQKGLVEGHTEFKRSAGVTGSGGALEHGSRSA